MPAKQLEKFLVLRAAVLFCILTPVSLFLLRENRLLILAGWTAGSLSSVFRFCCNAWVFTRLLRPEITAANPALAEKRTIAGSILVFSLNQLFLAPLLLLASLAGTPAFCGFVTGLVLVPAVVMINSVTEALGITKNRFDALR